MKARIRPRTETRTIGKQRVVITRAPLGRKAAAIIAPFTPGVPEKPRPLLLPLADSIRRDLKDRINFPPHWWRQTGQGDAA